MTYKYFYLLVYFSLIPFSAFADPNQLPPLDQSEQNQSSPLEDDPGEGTSSSVLGGAVGSADVGAVGSADVGAAGGADVGAADVGAAGGADVGTAGEAIWGCVSALGSTGVFAEAAKAFELSISNCTPFADRSRDECPDLPRTLGGIISKFSDVEMIYLRSERDGLFRASNLKSELLTALYTFYFDQLTVKMRFTLEARRAEQGYLSEADIERLAHCNYLTEADIKSLLSAKDYQLNALTLLTILQRRDFSLFNKFLSYFLKNPDITSFRRELALVLSNNPEARKKISMLPCEKGRTCSPGTYAPHLEKNLEGAEIESLQRSLLSIQCQYLDRLNRDRVPNCQDAFYSDSLIGMYFPSLARAVFVKFYREFIRNCECLSDNECSYLEKLLENLGITTTN